MKKLLTVGLGAVGAVSALAAAIVHGYLDVMYKETIPQTIIKRVANKNGTTGMKELDAFLAENCKWINEQKTEIIDLKNIYGYTLKGYYLPAEQDSKTFVVFAHGYRSSHMGDPANFERFYHEQGYNFFSVDHVTAGDSEGDFLGFDYFEANDLLMWLDYLVNRFGDDIKIILHGVSMGGATVCKMASRVPKQVKAIVSDCAYTSAPDEFLKVAQSVGVKKAGPAVIKVFNALNKKLAGFDLKETDVRQSVINAKAPMLFVHGDADDFVPVEMCYELYDLCGSEKDLLIVKGAYHAQSIMVDGESYKAKLVEFIGKYL